MEPTRRPVAYHLHRKLSKETYLETLTAALARFIAIADTFTAADGLSGERANAVYAQARRELADAAWQTRGLLDAPVAAQEGQEAAPTPEATPEPATPANAPESPHEEQ